VSMIARVNSRCFAQLFPGIRNSVKELIGRKMDALARHFAATNDMTVKNEIDRLARGYGKLGGPWEFVAR
jgi:hypothetical protein